MNESYRVIEFYELHLGDLKDIIHKREAFESSWYCVKMAMAIVGDKNWPEKTSG